MNKKIIPLLVLLFVFILLGFLFCTPSFERQEHTVEKIIDGNTIQLKNGLLVHLTGVENDDRAKEYLKKEVVNKDVKIRFDKKNKYKVTNRTEEIYGYVFLNRTCINSFLLSKSLSTLNTLYLTDSLVAFQKYANNESGVISTTNDNLATTTTNSTIEEIESTNQPILSLQELVKKIKPSVFLVGAFNRNTMIGQGTGFFISKEGKALSNWHVFEDGNNHKIKTIDGESHDVTEIITYDKRKDFVLFQNDINGNVPYLKLTKELPEEGEEIIVLGNPTGLESTLTRGIVSAIRNIEGIIYIQIDAAISPGSSGSPVLNKKGEVVGIATLKKMDCENCNFAVSIKTIANQIGL
jgi:serine protease Do